MDDLLVQAEMLVHQPDLSESDQQIVERTCLAELDICERDPATPPARRVGAYHVLARLRSAQGRFEEAVAMYVTCGSVAPPTLDHAGAAAFFLDAGSAAAKASNASEDSVRAGELAELAWAWTGQALVFAEQSEDHLQAAQALMNLVRLAPLGGLIDRVPTLLNLAQAHVDRVNDPGLHERLERLRDMMSNEQA